MSIETRIAQDLTDLCTVSTCAKPADGWYVCQQCADTFTNEILGEIGWILDDMDLVISQQVRYAHKYGGKSAETPLPINLNAADQRGKLLTELDTSSRLIADANQIEPDYIDGKTAASWLTYRISMIRLHPAGGEIIDGITREFAGALWLCDRPKQKQYLGDCKDHERTDDLPECPGSIYGIDGKPEARCDVCGSCWDADEMRTWLIAALEDRIMTAAEIAHMSTYLGLDMPREQVRKQVNKWNQRGSITPHATINDSPHFRFGDVLDLLARHVAKRMAG